MYRGILCALGLSVISMSYAKEPASKTDCGDSHHHPMRVSVRHLEPNGVGFNQGYTTLEAFFSPCDNWSDKWTPFLDARGHVFNNGKWAANAGLGLRYKRTSRIWGINSYYDYRQTKRQHYNQVAAGLESLGEVWDFRLNGYLPVGKKTSHRYQTQFAFFEDHSAILRRKQEFAMKAANAEAGAHVNSWENYPLYFAFGPYYLNGQGKSAWGGEARVSLGIYEYLKLEGKTSYDHIFKWIGQGEIGVTFPFGKKRKVKGVNCPLELALADRAVQPVDRMEIIPVDRKHKHSVAINPITGQPYTFWFVNNTSSSSGTFESPFPTLAQAQNASAPNDVIYVFPGDGTTTGMDKGITLQNNQRLWGSAVDQTLPTTVGTVTVPAMSAGAINGVGMLPILTNTTASSDVVTLANNNEISGLFLQNAQNNAIAGRNIANLRVLDCAMAGDNVPGATNGIGIVNVQGIVTVDNCIFNQADAGIAFVNDSNNVIASVTNSLFTSPLNGLVWVFGDSAQGTLVFDNNNMETTNSALAFVLGGNTNVNATIENNQILSSANTSIVWVAGGAGATCTLANNVIRAELQDFLLDQGNGTFTGTFTDNQLFSSTSNGIEAEIGGTSTQSNFTILGNTIYSSLDPILLNQTATNHTLAALVNNNQLSSATNDGLVVNAGGVSTSLIASGNTIQGGFRGVGLNQTSAANSLTAMLESNQIQASGDNGVKLTQLGNASLSMLANTVTSASDALIVTQSGGVFAGSFNDNQFTSITGSGVNLTANGLSASVGMIGNTLAASTNGLLLSVQGGTMSASMTGNTFEASTAVHAVMSNTSNTTLDLSNNTAQLGGGFFIQANNTAQALWTVNGNSFTALSSTPVHAVNAGSGKVCMEFNDNTAYPTQGAYIFSNTGGGTFTLNPPTNDIGQISLTNVTTGACP